MLKLVGEGPNGPVLILGLSDGNIERLKAGQPIRFTLAGLGVPWEGSIGIFHGKTEADMAKMMRDHGLIGPETRIHEDPSPGDGP